MPCCASKIHQGALWRCRAGGQVRNRSTWNNQKGNKNTPFWQVQATVKRNKCPCVSFLMSGGFTHRTRTVCCVVSLSVAMLGWQQRWLQRAPTDAWCSMKHNMIIWAKKSQRSCRIQLQRFCTLVLVTKSDEAIINSYYLCSISIRRKFPQYQCYENPEFLHWRKDRTGSQGSTSACDRGGGNMRGRGQMCRSAWVSGWGNNRNSAGTERERENYTRKQAIFIANWWTTHIVSGTWQNCLQHKIWQVTSLQCSRFLFQIINFYIFH